MTVAQVILPLSGRRTTQESVTRETRTNIIAVALLLIPIGTRDRGNGRDPRAPWPVAHRLRRSASRWRRRRRSRKQWERAVVLRLGRYVGLRGPGLFWIVPFVDSVTRWIDQRVITTSFAAEQTLTSDTVPVNVDAVLFWLVYDPEKAALEVQEYQQAVSWAAQTALRDIIGRTSLERSAARTRADRRGAAEADRRAVEPVGRDRAVGRDARRRHPGVAAGRDVARGAGVAREAGAHHPRPGRSRDRAHRSQKAAESYRNNPTALHLRAMNMLYEGLKEKGALMLVPSTAVESMGMGGLDGRGRAAPVEPRRGPTIRGPQRAPKIE